MEIQQPIDVAHTSKVEGELIQHLCDGDKKNNVGLLVASTGLLALSAAGCSSGERHIAEDQADKDYTSTVNKDVHTEEPKAGVGTALERTYFEACDCVGTAGLVTGGTFVAIFGTATLGIVALARRLFR